MKNKKLETLIKQTNKLFEQLGQLTANIQEKNKLADLQQYLFETIDKLEQGDISKTEFERVEAIHAIAREAVKNAKMICKYASKKSRGAQA